MAQPQKNTFLRIRKSNRAIVDDEEIVRLWMLPGNSFGTVADILAQRGVLNPVTGRHLGRDSISKAAWRWIFEHPEEMIERYIKPLCKHSGVPFDEEGFWLNYVSHTFSYCRASKRNYLLEKYGLTELGEQVEKEREKRPAYQRHISAQVR